MITHKFLRFVFVLAFLLPMSVRSEGLSTPSSEVNLKVIASDFDSLTLEFTASGFEVEDEHQDGSWYQIISLPGAGLTGEPGLPQVPVVGELVSLPVIEGVKIEIVERDFSTHSGYRLLPAPVQRTMPLPIGSSSFLARIRFSGRQIIRRNQWRSDLPGTCATRRSPACASFPSSMTPAPES
jgi:hypothetical protein